MFTENFIKDNLLIDEDNNIYYHFKEPKKSILFSLKNLLNPKYGHWELVTKVIRLYLQNYSVPSLCPPAYNNLLLIKAIIHDKIDILEMEIWQQRFNSKFPNLI